MPLVRFRFLATLCKLTLLASRPHLFFPLQRLPLHSSLPFLNQTEPRGLCLLAGLCLTTFLPTSSYLATLTTSLPARLPRPTHLACPSNLCRLSLDDPAVSWASHCTNHSVSQTPRTLTTSTQETSTGTAPPPSLPPPPLGPLYVHLPHFPEVLPPLCSPKIVLARLPQHSGSPSSSLCVSSISTLP